MKVLDSSIWSEAYDLSVPLQVPVIGDEQLVCNEVVRAMPGRRYVCRGTYDNKPVFIKLFSMTAQASREWKDEQQGIADLHSAGIPAPGIVYSESSAALSTQIVVYKELPGAESARQRWDHGNQTARQMLMMQLVELIAKHHAAGIRHKDCHLLNFIFSEDILYTLDAADIVKSATALSRKDSMQGLVDLLGLFPADQDKLITSLYEHYWQSRNAPTDKHECEQLKHAVEKMRDYKLRKYLDKTYRDCSAFAVNKRWNYFSTILRDKNKDEMQLLLSKPDIESDKIQRSVIKDGNTCTVSVIKTPQQEIVCKRYNIKNPWHGLMRAFRLSRASVSWRNAHRLIKYGIATPEPIALLEKRFGPVRRQAWFFMEHIQGINAYHIFRDADKTPLQMKNAAAQFVALFEKMIQAKLSHGDMKVTNFIFSDEKLFVIDLDAMQQHHAESDFETAFRTDMARFMRNWSELPEIEALFIEQLSHSAAEKFLPSTIKS